MIFNKQFYKHLYIQFHKLLIYTVPHAIELVEACGLYNYIIKTVYIYTKKKKVSPDVNKVCSRSYGSTILLLAPNGYFS